MRGSTTLFVVALLALTLAIGPTVVAAQRKVPSAKEQLEFGIDMAQRGLWSEALFRFRQAERIEPEAATVLNNVAVSLEALGQFDEALEYYRRALRVEPANRSLKRNYARFAEFYQSFKRSTEEEQAADEAPPSSRRDDTQGGRG